MSTTEQREQEEPTDADIREAEDHVAGLIQTEVERIFREEMPDEYLGYTDPDEIVRWVADEVQKRGIPRL